MNLNYPKNTAFTCNDCGICCGDTKTKTRHILLTQKDADRITKHTNQTINAFADKTDGKAPYIYEMHKNPQTGKCIFHKNNQCTIYAHRPLICRFYPFQLTTQNNKHTFEVTSECPGVTQHLDTLKGREILGNQHFMCLLQLAQDELQPTDDSDV